MVKLKGGNNIKPTSKFYYRYFFRCPDKKCTYQYLPEMAKVYLKNVKPPKAKMNIQVAKDAVNAMKEDPRIELKYDLYRNFTQFIADRGYGLQRAIARECLNCEKL